MVHVESAPRTAIGAPSMAPALAHTVAANGDPMSDGRESVTGVGRTASPLAAGVIAARASSERVESPHASDASVTTLSARIREREFMGVGAGDTARPDPNARPLGASHHADL
jgi:hypothetical protein